MEKKMVQQLLEKNIPSIQVRLSTLEFRSETNDALHNPRQVFNPEHMESLYNSIKNCGLMHPIMVCKDKDKYQVIAGERRTRTLLRLVKKDEIVYNIRTGKKEQASKLYEFVDVRILPDNSPETLIAYTITENGEHSQLSEYEVMQYLVKISQDKKYSMEQISKMFHRCNGWVSQTLSLNKLPRKILEALHQGILTRTAAIEFLSVKENQIDNILQKAENIERQKQEKDIQEAELDENKANEYLQEILKKAEKAKLQSDYSALKKANKLTEKAKKLVTSAQLRTKKVKEKNLNITTESANLAILQLDGSRKEDFVSKPLTPKIIRKMKKEVTELLEKNITTYKGLDVPLEKLKIVNKVYEQILGNTKPSLEFLIKIIKEVA